MDREGQEGKKSEATGKTKEESKTVSPAEVGLARAAYRVTHYVYV